jgi:hypothetical protein
MSNSIPFSTQQFFQVFEKYNQTIYPMQFVLISVAQQERIVCFSPSFT